MLAPPKLLALGALLFASAMAQNQTAVAFDRSNATIANATAWAFPGQNLTTITIEYQPPTEIVNNTGHPYNITYQPVRRRVSYFVMHDLAIIDGDVIFGSEAELLEHRVPDDEPGEVTKRTEDGTALQPRALSLGRESSLKWPNGRVEYNWESQATKDARVENWLAACKIWTDRLPFLSFVDKGTFQASGTLNGPVVLRLDPGGVSSSPVGRAQSGAGNNIILGEIGTGPGSQIGVYVHEIGHTLGLIHEQMRPDRDAYMTLDCSRVCGTFVMKPPPLQDEVDHCTDAHCDPPTCIDHGCNFHKLSATDASIDWSGPYDVLSIMQYGAYLFGRPETGYLPPMTATSPKIPLRGGNGDVPTLLDLQRVCNLYYKDCRGICGDGILSPNNDEECDDGNNDNGDGCDSDCRIRTPPPVCGNGILETGEQCDDGNTVDGDGCNSVCRTEYCGDGIVQSGLGEECDDGPSGSSDCTSSCKKACLPTCDPDPRENKCDQTTSCITIEGGSGSGTHYCACAHGFRGAGVAAGDVAAQMRLPWPSQQGRVFVRPGVQCNVLCDQWTLGKDGCTEVEERAMCYI